MQRERERSADYCMFPDQESNLQFFGAWDGAPTN